MCSREGSDVVVGVEVGVEGMGDGVVGNLLGVVEAGFLLCDRYRGGKLFPLIVYLLWFCS